MDVTDKGFIEAVREAGLTIPKSETTLWLLDGYKEKLENVWNKYKGAEVEILNVMFEDQEWEVEIPLSVKGQLWCWVCDKPVANQNPYKTLFDHIKVPMKQEEVIMFLATENIPDNFDLRTSYNNEWVKEDPSLGLNEIRIELRPVEAGTISLSDYMKAVKGLLNVE